MPRGPRLNDISKSFTTRDSLGIEGVATTIQGEICPIINTVTPRAFYWPFMVWIYYDFYEHSGIKEYNVDAFNNYLKRQDYFFVLATLLTADSDQSGLVGKQQTQLDINDNPSGPYKYNPNYFQTKFGGMQYYNAGCLSMYFVTDHDDATGKEFSLPRLSQHGKKMAIAFENVIKNTRYYKEFRSNDEAVPKIVLEEYGKVINFGLHGFDECKAILREYLFEKLPGRSSLLKDNANYITYIIDTYGVSDWNRAACRQMVYDNELANGEKITVPSELLEVSHRWEIVVGRQYFTSGIEMIWKYILEILNEPMTMKEWIESAMNQSAFIWNLDDNLNTVIEKCNYNYADREQMISDATRDKNVKSILENGLRVMLSVYNRFSYREDLGDEKIFLEYGYENHSIPLQELLDTVDRYKEKPIKDFLICVIKEWVIEQHYVTAFEKMLQNRDGFFYELVDEKFFKKFDFGMRFQDIRLTSLRQVMIDIDML